MKRILLLIALTALLPALKSSATQLSGSYTIDSAGTASTTVFKDFASAVIYMTSTGTRPDGGPSNSGTVGVSGPVIFDVMQGTYTGQVDIPVITGASATNNVTFDGGLGNVDSRILVYSAASTTDAHTVRLNGASWVNLRNLTIKSLSAAAGVGVHFYNAATNNSIRQCKIIMASVTTTTFNVKAINITNSNISSTGNGCSGAAGAAFNIYIDSNFISGGNQGVFMSSSVSSSGGSHNFYIRWNRFEDIRVTGIGASGSNGYLIESNYIKMATGNTTSKGIHHCNGSSSGIMYYGIKGNTIENAGQYGIHFQSNNSNTGVLYPTLVCNNYIMPTFSNATSYGFNFSQPRNHKIYNNTILMNMAGGYGIDLSTTSTNANCAAKNNIIQLLSPASTGLCIRSTALTIDSCDYNVFTKGGSQADLLQLRGTTYTRFNFQGGGGFNDNSTMDDPMLGSVADPRPRNICQKGTPIGWVTVDRNNLTRPNPPQIGAYEGVGGISVDAGVVSIIQPATYPVSSGYQDAKVIIKNSGLNTLTSVDVSIQIGTVVQTVNWTGTLLTCATDTVTFTGSYQISLASGTNVLKVYTGNPNYSVDSNATNDTLLKTFCTPLATGNYTIGSGGTFATFTEVASVLNCGGIVGTGPTTFDVISGTYNEQLALGAIPGVSEDNPIIFRSMAMHPDSVTLSYSSGTGGNYIVQLNGTSFTRFENMTMRALSTSSGIVMEIGGNASYDTIINCNLIGPAVASTGTALALVYASGITSKRNAFINNMFTNGSYGMYYYGGTLTTPADSNLIQGNTFTNCYYMTIALSNHSNVKVIGNTINASAYSSSYGIYMTTCANAIEVSKNYVRGQIGAYGIMLSSVNGTALLQGKVTNNIVTGGTTSSYYGLYMASCTNLLVSHNTISANSTAATNYAGWTQFTASTGTTVVIRNNIFCSNGLSTAITNAALYVYNKDYLNSNYNNLYCAGTNLVNVVTPAVTHPNLYSWKVANPYEKNSVSYRPGLISFTNPFPNPNDSASWSINGHGTYLTYDQRDYFDNPRPTNIYEGAPDLGAVEFTPVSVPPIATTSPTALAPDSMQVFMFAGDTVAKIKWGPFASVPGYINVRQYSGTRPPHIDTTADNYMNVFTDFEVPYGFYDYSIYFHYKENWRGRIATESDLKLAKYDSTAIFTSPWTVYSSTMSTVDSINNFIYATSLSSFSFYTGTDNNNPLPVTLGRFVANRVGADVSLNWNTLSEINTSHFEIEKSINGVDFRNIGKVQAARNSSTERRYNAMDRDAWTGLDSRVLYYRLKMVDLDRSFEYSPTVTVYQRQIDRETITASPNPFFDQFNLNVFATNPGSGTIRIFDLQGHLVYEGSVQLTTGENQKSVGALHGLPAGIYLLELKTSEDIHTLRILKGQ